MKQQNFLCKTLAALGLATLLVAMPSHAPSAATQTIYKVTDFGASGKDKLDDTDAINNALKLGNTDEPISVVIPKGTYYINSSLKIYGNTSLQLEDGATIISTQYMPRMLYNPSNSSSAPISISGGMWNANKSKTDTNIISIKNCDALTIKDTAIRNNAGTGILVQDSNSTLENVTVSASYKSGINLQRKTAVVKNCSVTCGKDSSENAIYLRDLTKASISGTTLNTPGKNGITANTVQSLSISNCTITSPKECGISVQNSNATIEKVTVRYAPKNAISVQNKSGIIKNCNLTAPKYADDTNKNKLSTKRDRDLIRLANLTSATVSGTKLTNAGYNAITANTVKKLTVTGCDMKNPRNCAVTAKDCTNVTLKNNKVIDHFSDGFWIENKSNAITSITNNQVGRSTKGTPISSGIVVFYGKKINIQNNTVTDSLDNAIYTKISDDVTISGNKIKNTGENGIYTWKTKCTISNNDITAPNNNGLSINTASACKVSKNTIRNAKQIGIYAYDGKNTTITENTISSSGSHGISVKNTNTASISKNKTTKTKKAGVYAESSTAVRVESNEITGSDFHAIYTTKTKGSIKNNRYTPSALTPHIKADGMSLSGNKVL